MTFCSAGWNFHVKCLALGSLYFLVTIVKPALGAILVDTVAQEAGANVVVVGAEEGVS